MKKILEKIRFGRIVLGRALKILFRRDKDIQLLHLDYSDNHIFENSFQPIEYRFRNALWYRFDGRNTLEKELRILNFPNAATEFDLVVVGLFRKQIYRIVLKPTLRLNTQSFRTELASFGVEFLPMQPLELPKKFKPKIPEIEILEPKLEMHVPDVSFEFTPYNQNELI